MAVTCLDQLDQYIGFYCHDGKYLINAAFDPLTGNVIASGLKSYFVGVLCREFSNKEKGNKKAIEQKVLDYINEWKNAHSKTNSCPRLYDLVLGDDAGTTRAAYLPMIRAYIVYKQYFSREIDSYNFEEFDVMKYCPFCGAELPVSLENELSCILQTEYGLTSWKDYKKAQLEFHSDEWWKKRGL